MASQAIAIMLEKHSIACDLLHSSDWQKAVGDGKKTLFALPALQEHLLELKDGKSRWENAAEMMEHEGFLGGVPHLLDLADDANQP